MNRRDLITNLGYCSFTFFGFFKAENRMLDIEGLKRLLKLNEIQVGEDITEDEVLNSEIEINNFQIQDPRAPESSILNIFTDLGINDFRFYKLDEISTINGGYDIKEPPREILYKEINGKIEREYRYDLLQCAVSMQFN